MAQLGMPLYGCQTPNGYKNTEDAWLNADALTRRITFATALADGKLALAARPPPPSAPAPSPPLDAAQLQATLASSVSSRTRELVAAAAAPLRAAMLLGSPDFMQR